MRRRDREVPGAVPKPDIEIVRSGRRGGGAVGVKVGVGDEKVLVAVAIKVGLDHGAGKGAEAEGGRRSREGWGDVRRDELAWGGQGAVYGEIAQMSAECIQTKHEEVSVSLGH